MHEMDGVNGTDDLGFKEALRRYVESDEPPFSLTAKSLMSEGRRRQRWRLGVGLGGGSAATVLAIAASMALVPTGAGTLDWKGCDQPLPTTGWPMRPTPTAQPPDYPSLFPSGGPTAWPSGGPSVLRSDWPSPTFLGVTPSAYASDLPFEHSPPPTGQPSGSTGNAVSPEPYISVPPTGSMEGDPDQARVDEMSCYLKRRMVEFFPRGSFIRAADPPMDVSRYPVIIASPRGRAVWGSQFHAATYVVYGEQMCLVIVNVRVQPDDFSVSDFTLPDARKIRTRKKHDAYLGSSYGGSFDMTVITGHSVIQVSVEGTLLTVEQAIDLAEGEELDLFR